MEELKKKLKGKKIVVLGMGDEGLSTAGIIRDIFPEERLSLADALPYEKLSEKAQNFIKEHHSHLDLFFGEDYLQKIDDHDLLIKAPGVPPHIVENLNCEITSQTKLFFEFFQGTIVGVTGTKGKSTTVSLIYHILDQAGMDVIKTGNIGTPALEKLPQTNKNTICVYELSSHQLNDLDQSPHIAVLLPISPEHLQYHQSFENYLAAKSRITLYQEENDYLFFHPQTLHIAEKSKAKKIEIDESLGREVLKTAPLAPLYAMNCAVSVQVTELLGVRGATKLTANFAPLPHRLEPVGEYGGVIFYNDSAASAPPSTQAALKSLQASTLIAGGYDRGLEWKDLAKSIAESDIETLILLPDNGEIIEKEVKKITKKIEVIMTSTLEEAVDLAKKKTKKGGTCLFSPGAPSFNLFRNYEERGKRFKNLVKAKPTAKA